MSLIKHHAIVVTSYNRMYIRLFHDMAKKLFGGQVTPIIKAPINTYYTFFVGPDGSGEGREDSQNGDEARKNFLLELEGINYLYRGRAVDYAIISYGDEYERKAEIVHHN